MCSNIVSDTYRVRKNTFRTEGTPTEQPIMYKEGSGARMSSKELSIVITVQSRVISQFSQ